jgi:hypothetical protein
LDKKTTNNGIIVDTRLGGVPRYFLGYPEDWNMRISEEILKCVAFIGIKESSGFSARATGFFVQVPLETQEDMYVTHFVTARHNVEEIEKEITNGGEVYIRLNGTDGSVKDIKVEKNARWLFHPTDSNVDVAVIPFPTNLPFDWKVIPLTMFLPDEHLKSGKIGIGDEVFITGLFTRHFGRQKNLPIIRVGNIAMISDEKVHLSWHGGVEIDAYLIEARSIGGISGSPVFFVKSPMDAKGTLHLGGMEYHLGGLIHGHWPVDESKIDSAVDISEEKNVNMGIAIVIPAKKILETLNQDELKEMRLLLAQEHKKRTAPVMD